MIEMYVLKNTLLSGILLGNLVSITNLKSGTMPWLVKCLPSMQGPLSGLDPQPHINVGHDGNERKTVKSLRASSDTQTVEAWKSKTEIGEVVSILVLC